MEEMAKHSRCSKLHFHPKRHGHTFQKGECSHHSTQSVSAHTHIACVHAEKKRQHSMAIKNVHRPTHKCTSFQANMHAHTYVQTHSLMAQLLCETGTVTAV